MGSVVDWASYCGGVTGVGLASARCSRGHGEPCVWGRGSRGHHGGGVTLLPCTDPHSLLVFQVHGDPATLWQPVSKSGVWGPDAPVHHRGRGAVTGDEHRLLFTLGLTIPGPVEICGAVPSHHPSLAPRESLTHALPSLKTRGTPKSGNSIQRSPPRVNLGQHPSTHWVPLSMTLGTGVQACTWSPGRWCVGLLCSLLEACPLSGPGVSVQSLVWGP